MIKINDLAKSYGKKEVLHNINISFGKGMVYGIVGENGSGKTTLFRCIAGLEKYEGIISSDLPSLKNQLGLLTTEPYFFSKITGREYIQFLCNARKISPGDIDQRNIFNLPLDQYASTYSTGMKKKLALSAVLLQGNDCLILDEPFNGVDIQSNIVITSIIHKLRDLGKTVIISSHIFSILRDTCDEIHLLKEGTFKKKVLRPDYDVFEAEINSVAIGDKLDKLALN